MNTFLTFKTKLQNDQIEESLSQIAQTIANPLQVGWSIASQHINSSGNYVFRETEDGLNYIILNHAQGSSLQLGYYEDDNSNIVTTITLLPPQTSESFPLEKDHPLSKNISDLFGTLFSTTNFDLWISIDTKGNGFIFYYMSPSSQNIAIVMFGSFLKHFCYPQEDNNVLKTLYASGTSGNSVFDGTAWQTCALDITFFEPDSIGFYILVPVLIIKQGQQPYGFIESNVFSLLSRPNGISVPDGYVTTDRNHILYGGSFAFGWSPLNTRDVNPWYEGA